MERKLRMEGIRTLRPHKKYVNQKHSSEERYVTTRPGCTGNGILDFKFNIPV